MEKVQKTTAAGFEVRAETLFKNAALIRARETLDLTIRAVASSVKINHSTYGRYERMMEYPDQDKQKRICDFFREREVFLIESIVFPEYLRFFTPRKKYISAAEIPADKLIPLHQTDARLLPIDDRSVERYASQIELTSKIEQMLSHLNPMQEAVIRAIYGIGRETIMNHQDIAKEMNISRERVRQIGAKAIEILRRKKMLQDYLDI